MRYEYEINPRATELGGGWQLRLLEDGEEVGGGTFALPEYIDLKDETEVACAAGWVYEDALAEATAWLVSRP